MANIYKEGSEELHSLLERAGNPSGVSVLVPDLQRPYVWQPKQVTLLVDSLIRGWPFGTLLLWKVSGDGLSRIPFRGLWTQVDRTESDESLWLTQANPPASYHMILDGQQRVQSLLLALYGDDWGFRLTDRDWHEALSGERQKGRAPKHQHWSKASLCFDLERFAEEYFNEGESLVSVDFEKVLEWAIVDPSKGQSDYKTPDNYSYPLVAAYAKENQPRLVRLSRLWALASPDANLRERHFKEKLVGLLEQHGIEESRRRDLIEPLAELLSTFRDLKLSRLTYLELQDFNPDHWRSLVGGETEAHAQDAYNEAIVSIFTRLNTAGRTLSREEITLAWLKVGWDKSKTDQKLAGQCFQDLLGRLSANGVVLGIDDLVAAVSITWSIVAGTGQLLTNSDLLKSEVIQPMAADLCGRWKSIHAAYSVACDVLEERDLKYGARAQVSSLYALAIFASWIYLTEAWKGRQRLLVTQEDDFQKKCRASIVELVDRWMLCSQWASTWSQSSTSNVSEFMRDLKKTWEDMERQCTVTGAHTCWESCMKRFIVDFVPKAAAHVNSEVAESKERVSTYRNLLWIWHRLDKTRWEMSRIPLRALKKGTSIDVDHTVSFELWKTLIEASPSLPSGFTDEDSAIQFINSLGNCALLEKNFNISKGKKTLGQFLSDVHEFSEKKHTLEEWIGALKLSDAMVNPTVDRIDEIAIAITKRDAAIREELVMFIRGEVARVDAGAGDQGGTDDNQEEHIAANVM